MKTVAENRILDQTPSALGAPVLDFPTSSYENQYSGYDLVEI